MYLKSKVTYRERENNHKLGEYTMKEKRVLISAPIGGHKQYSINTWFEWIARQSYINFDVCLCANGDVRKELLEKIKEVKIKHNGEIKGIIGLELPNSDSLSIIQKITYARETIRRYAVKEGYEAIFWLDTDTIPANKNAISRLLSWDLDSISGLYFYKESSVPVAIDPDTNTNFNLEKLESFVNINKVVPAWGYGYGCLIHQRKAMNTPFDYELFGEERTDDFGHCEALENAGVPRFLDPFVLCKHLGEKEPLKKINEMLGVEEWQE